MILNHKAAIEFLVEEADSVGFNQYTLQNLHALLADGLLGNPAAQGRLRQVPVGISGTVYEPTAIPQLIDECFSLILAKATEIADPFEQAFFVLVQLPYLQPFEDVNKRVSRLAANIPLIRHNLIPLSFVGVPQRTYVEALRGVYELHRVELLRDRFEWAYARSWRRYTVIQDTLPPPDPVRQRWRIELADSVTQTVVGGKPINEQDLRRALSETVDSRDVPEVLAMALNELHLLHEGNIARFRIRLVEFQRWISGISADRKAAR